MPIILAASRDPRLIRFGPVGRRLQRPSISRGVRRQQQAGCCRFKEMMMRPFVFLALMASVAAQAQTALPLPAGYPSLLGVSCVYAWTRCGGSGRGGGYRSTTYQSWHSIHWDLNLSYTLQTYDGVAPDPAFTDSDMYGNLIMNVCSGITKGLPACVASATIVYVPPPIGPVTVNVPQLYGLPAAAAASTLQALGLVEVTHAKWSTTVPIDQVCGQKPKAGKLVPAGSTIKVCISRGPD
jgi:hypothetical protein